MEHAIAVDLFIAGKGFGGRVAQIETACWGAIKVYATAMQESGRLELGYYFNINQRDDPIIHGALEILQCLGKNLWNAQFGTTCWIMAVPISYY